MRMLRLMAPALVLVLIGAACAADEDGDGDGAGGAENTGQVNILSAGDPGEVEIYNGIIDEMINADADYTAEIEASGEAEQQAQIRAEAGTLDVFLAPQPGLVADLAQAGQLTSLEDLGMDVGQLEELFGEYFVSLGEVDGQHYGVPTNINLKSMIWYPKDDFDAAGYTEPTTFDELMALSDEMVADGNTPWCVGFESGSATGWPATDWMEDIMLRTAGPDVYDQWVAHDIPFNDPQIIAAFDAFKKMTLDAGQTFGGGRGVL